MDIHSVRQQLRTKSIYDIPLRVTYYARVSSGVGRAAELAGQSDSIL